MNQKINRRQVEIPDWSRNAVIYEVNLRQYTKHGTFREFMEELPRLKDLGVDILWLMPIFPIGEKNRKGTLGSYYSVRDFMAVNPSHGSLDDFKDLVNHAHELRMYVILDWVANHSSWDNQLIYNHPEWYSQNEKGNIMVPAGTDWSDAADLNYSMPGLRKYMIEAMRFWLVETGVDGFRCDVAGMVPTDFWAAAYDELIQANPDLFMLAEWDDPVLHEVAFHMSYAWDVHKAFNGIYRGEKRVSDLYDMLNADRQRYDPTSYRMHFTSNHDENSWNGSEFQRLGEAYECFAALTYVIPGMPLIYSGQEAGSVKQLSFFDKDAIEWKPHKMFDVYKKLNSLKHSNNAIWNGAWGGDSQVLQCSDSDVFAIKRSLEDHEVIGLFNLKAQKTVVRIEEGALNGTYVDLNGDAFVITEEQDFHFNSWGYLILSR